MKNNNFDYADLVGFLGEHKQTAGWIVFVIMVIIVTAAVSNGANLNDGMDGMAAGNSAFICIALGILAYVSSHVEYASYLNIMFVPGSQELVIFICATVGALIGFLWYNAYPAQVFMGDTGSLTIGGIIGVLAIIIHKRTLGAPALRRVPLRSVSVIIQPRCSSSSSAAVVASGCSRARPFTTRSAVSIRNSTPRRPTFFVIGPAAHGTKPRSPFVSGSQRSFWPH